MTESEEIARFDGEYHFLSNFYQSPFTFSMTLPDGTNTEVIEAESVEQAYQACKATNMRDFLFVLEQPDPRMAKKAGRKIKVRDDWERIKVQIMRYLVHSKFTQNQNLQEKLLGTGEAKLVEGNWWGDRFWGVCKGKGENWLGKILMDLRESFK